MDNNIPPSGANNKAVFALIALVILAVAGAAWWYFSRSKEEPAPVPEPIKTSEDVAEAVTLPEIEVGSNPVENKVPEINPVDRANPFKDAYQNPFE